MSETNRISWLKGNKSLENSRHIGCTETAIYSVANCWSSGSFFFEFNEAVNTILWDWLIPLVSLSYPCNFITVLMVEVYIYLLQNNAFNLMEKKILVLSLRSRILCSWPGEDASRWARNGARVIALGVDLVRHKHLTTQERYGTVGCIRGLLPWKPTY